MFSLVFWRFNLMNFNFYTLEAAESSAQSCGGMSIIVMIGYIVIIFGDMYFLLIRPQRKKQKDDDSLEESPRPRQLQPLYDLIDNNADDDDLNNVCDPDS